MEQVETKLFTTEDIDKVKYELKARFQKDTDQTKIFKTITDKVDFLIKCEYIQPAIKGVLKWHYYDSLYVHTTTLGIAGLKRNEFEGINAIIYNGREFKLKVKGFDDIVVSVSR